MDKKKKNYVRNLTLSAMFLAIGLLLPFLTAQIQQIGNMLCPMHIPVLLCGLICGWQYGFAVGAVMPIMRNWIFHMPPIYPTGLAMAFELATYGLLVGILYNSSKWKCIVSLYRSMIAAMLGGRLVWGAAMMIILGTGTDGFTWKAFYTGAFLNAIPGIILQLILIPTIMIALNRTGLVKFSGKKHNDTEA